MKTLGVKFQVAGVKEAQASLNNLKNAINASVNSAVGATSNIPKTIKTQATASIKVQLPGIQKFSLELNNLNKSVDRNISSVTSSIRKYQTEVNEGFSDWRIENFGNTVQKQNLIIKREAVEFKGRSTYQGLDKNARNTVLEQRLLFKELALDLRQIVNKDLKEVITESAQETNNNSAFDSIKQMVTSPLESMFDAVMFPFQSMIAGAFERIGEVQTQDFAEGFNKKIQKSLGLPFETVGEDLGDIFGSSLYRTYESILKRSREAIISDLDDKSPQVEAFVKDLKNTLLAAMLKGAAMPVRAHKRIQMRKKAVPLAKQETGEMMINRTITPEERQSVEKSNSITLLTGGVTMDAEGNNTEFVERLTKGYLTDTHVVPVKNPWSNSKMGAEYKQVTMKLLKNILSNPSVNGRVKEYLKSSDNENLLKGLDTEGEIDLNDNFVSTILDFLEKKDLPFIKVLETAYEGYNLDDVTMAATAMFYKQHFPDKPINIVGTSGGGLNAAGTMELLNVMGYDDVKASGISTPITGLEFTGNEDNYLVSLGDKDFIYEGIYNGIFKDILLPPDYMNVLPEGGKGHMLPLYLADPNFQGRFAEHNKGRMGVQKDVGLAEMSYITRLGQYPESENLLRTLKKNLGEETDEGYYYADTEGLKVLARDLKKKSKRMSNAELKKRASDTIDFIETLAEELEVISVLGDKVKPLESLKKASLIYPELEPLVEKYQGQEVDEKVKKSVKTEAKENKPFIDFKQKLAWESGNIERTLRALKGEKVSGYAFYDSEEYQARASDLEGLINHLSSDVLKGANLKQKAKSFKYLDFLERLKSAIILKGKQDIEIDPSLVTEGKELLGFDIPEVQKTKVALPRGGREPNIAVAKENADLDPHEATPRRLLSSNQELVEAYNNHLASIISASNKRAVEDLEGSRVNIDKVAEYERIKSKIKEYRKVVKDGQFESARELGEAILNESEYLKQVFSENESSKKSQLTRMQTEIVSGDAGIGRSSVGLGELPFSTKQVQFELDLEPTTRQTADGAKENLNRESGNVVGAEFAEGIIEGATDKLDIQSPSRVFQWIGSMVKAGFTKGVTGVDEPLVESVSRASDKTLDAYKKYLRSIKGYHDAEMQIFAEDKLSEYGNLNPAEKSEYVQKFGARRQKSIAHNTEQLNDYREAIDTGNISKAKEIAEDLLGEVNSLKVAYQQIADSLPDGDEFKGVAGDFLAHLDSVRAEIINGNELGSEVVEDFARGVEANLQEVRDVGEQVTENLESGIDSSPIESAGEELSKTLTGAVSNAVAEATDSVENEGESLIDRAAEWVSNVASELDDSEGLLDPLLETEGADEAVNDFLGNLVSQISDVFDAITERFPILGRISNLLMSIGGEVLQVLGIFSFGEALIEFSTQALQTAMEVESLERSIRAVSRSASDGVSNIKFIRDEARRLSIDLITAEEAYKRILGATRNTPLEGLQTEQIFSTLATTAKNRGLNTDATSRLFLGFEQAIAKGEFRAEEVRGQLAEVMGDVQNLLATSVGVPTSQLGELMEAGDLKVVEVMPKLLAQLDAQNAAIGDSAGTAAAAQTRFNNAILEYQDAVGRQIQPVQKLGLNTLAAVIETLRDRATELAKLGASFFITVLVNLTLRLLATRLATAALGDAIYRLGFALGSVLPKLILFLKRFVLITAAVEVWTNVIKLAKHPLPELDARVENSTKRLDALRKAFDGAGDAATKNGKKFGTLQLNEGMDLSGMPGWVQKIAGGDRLNWDNLVRNRMKKLLGRFFPKKETTTQAQRKQNTFISDSKKLIANVDSTLSYSKRARGVLDEIAELDKKARDLESKRSNILPGDSEGLKAALAEEQKIQKERDLLLKKSSQYAESLQGDIQAITETLGELDELDKTGGSEEEVIQRERIRDSLEERLGLLESEKKAIDEINSRIPDFLSQIDRLLRNIDIKVRGFIARQDDDAISKRTEIIERAIREGTSEVDLEIQLDNLSATDLEDRMAFLTEQIKELEKNLNSAYLSEGVTGLERAAEEQGMGELTSAAIEELLAQGRTSQETKAGNLLLALDEYEGMVAQSQSELVDLIKNNRDKLIDYNRTVSDYFSRITQQIKEAALETQRLISQIFYTDLKNTLRRAIAPGSNTFVNGVIDNIQSVLDGASALAEKAFGDSSAQLSFEMEVQTLAVEMNEFIRQIISAGDALSGLVKRLGGYSTSSNTKEDAGTRVSRVPRVVRGDATPAVLAQPNGQLATYADPAQKSEIGNVVDPDLSGYYKNPESYQHKDYITKTLKQPAGVDTGVEQMLSLIKEDAVPGETPGNDVVRSDPSSPRSVPQVLSIVSQSQTSPEKLGGAALQVNERLIERKRFNLELQKYSTEQERDAYITNADNIIETNRRSIEQSVKESQRTLIDLEGKFEDFSFQYDYASAGNELKKALRDVKTTFLDTNSDIDTQIQNTVDAIKTIESLAKSMPGDITRLRSYGTAEALKLADVKQSGLNELLVALPKLQNNLTKILDLQNDSSEVESNATEFTERQGELKIEIEAIDKKSAIAQLKSNLALEVGTIEQIKQIKLEQERYRLKTAIANIELNEKPSPERDELIATERKQSILNTENIEFDSKFSKLDLEKQSIDYQSSIGDKKAGFLSRVGFDIKADAIRKKGAIASEDNRFRRELLELEKKYRYQPKLLEQFTRAATELNSVNLQSIENEFKSLGKTIEDNFISSTQNFFSQFVSSGFDFTAQREKAVLEERLRYAEQLNSLENQYREQPGQLAHMKNRARELNEEKLDKIRNEFNLFSRTVDLAKQAIAEFIKQLAAMVARTAAAKFISSVLGGAIGGGGGSSASAIGSAFVADKGITVGERTLDSRYNARKALAASNPRNALSRKISDRNTSILRRAFPGIKSAWSAEGSDAQLGVFHTGEELLSRKTGEAGRYQLLKRELGINPLDKILNYSEGGTIPMVGNNILSGIPTARPRIDLTGLNNSRRSLETSSSKTINISQTIVSPDADSFRLNEDQRNQDLVERLRRGI